jgi:acetyl esterase/lipase
MSDTELHPPIDAELFETVWPSVVEAGRGFTFGLTLDRIPALREFSETGFLTDTALRRRGTVELEERVIPGPPGAPDLPALILRPATRTGPLPCIYFVANGGKIVRSPRASLTYTEPDWVIDLGVVIVSVPPRVAPEDPHPAQVDDAYAGLVWTAEHAEELGIDPDQILLMGKSGGGGVAAATALLARDRGGPAISHQILVYPMLDDREVTVSSKFEGVMWDRATNKTAWSAMLGDSAGGPDVSPYAAPARATDLSGLPPAYFETGSSEVFRDEIIGYAARLAEAGVPVDLHCWAGGYHGFELTAPDAVITRAALDARLSYVRRALRPARRRSST